MPSMAMKKMHRETIRGAAKETAGETARASRYRGLERVLSLSCRESPMTA